MKKETGIEKEMKSMNSRLIVPSSVPADLGTYEVASCDLNYEYWTPDKPGEFRRMVYLETSSRSVPDHKDPTINVELPVAVFLYPSADGNKTVVNGSKRLIAVFENSEIESGTPVQVTYKGKKRNRTNANMSDDWGVVTLVKKAAVK